MVGLLDLEIKIFYLAILKIILNKRALVISENFMFVGCWFPCQCLSSMNVEEGGQFYVIPDHGMPRHVVKYYSGHICEDISG